MPRNETCNFNQIDENQGAGGGLAPQILGYGAPNRFAGPHGSWLNVAITYGETAKRTLAQDDVDGLSHLYLVKGCAAPPSPGSNGCSKGTPVGDGPPPKLDLGPSNEGGADGPSTEGGRDGPVSGDKPASFDGPTSGSEASAEGGSAKQCTSTSQCPAGYICSAEGQCVKVGGQQEEDEGCGCQVGSRGGGRLALLSLLLGGLLLLRRRR